MSSHWGKIGGDSVHCQVMSDSSSREMLSHKLSKVPRSIIQRRRPNKSLRLKLEYVATVAKTGSLVGRLSWETPGTVMWWLWRALTHSL